MGVTPNSWMVYFMETPINSWMMTGGTFISGKLQALDLDWDNAAWIGSTMVVLLLRNATSFGDLKS